MAAASKSTSSSISLKEYLKKYQSGTDDQNKKKKKKKKEKPKPNSVGGGVLVVDEDPVWQKPVQLEGVEEDDSAGEEEPQIDEDIEVKRMKRLEAIRSRKPYHAISDDGSGWVSISDQPKSLNPADGGSDLSPPRQRRPRFDTPSPDREQKPDDTENPDLSPPRQRRRRFHSPAAEPQPRASDSGERLVDLLPPLRKPSENLSPPRRARHHSSEISDLSPPRRSRKGSLDDLSPPRRNKKGSSDDLSPPRQVHWRSPETTRRGESFSDDLSPMRRKKEPSLVKEVDLSPPRKKKEPSVAREADLSPPRRRKEPSLVKEVRKTGLLSAEEIREENEKKRKAELSRFASMDPSISGRGAEPVFRDKEGKRISKEELLKSQEEEKPKEKKLEWGKGLAQKREAEARTQELELEKDKPFARTRDDPELDKMLKERIRWGDPMAHLVKKNSEPVLEDLGNDEKMKESGFIIPQTIPSHSWIKRGIDFPPNRYGLRPGRHWDGVDRSNGYEKELFKRQNEKRATETEAYLWSVSDM